jgi:hypothetical protein
MRQEGPWPRSGSCPLLAWRCKWPRRFCRPSARASAPYCRHRRHRALRYFRQHFLPPPPGAACPRASASSSLVEVLDRRGCAAADFVGLVRRGGATRVLCRGCSMWRHAALRSVGCSRMRSWTPKPTTNIFGQRLGAKSIIPARRRGVPNGAIGNQMFRAFPKKP